MKASELQPQLRIGNFLQDRNGRLCKVKELGEGTIYAPALKGATTSIPNEPIPLTEEWLLKFGFTRNKDTYYLNDLGLSWLTTEDNFQTEYKLADSKWKLLDLKYVHQLQNLYFALCGEELELK